MINFLKNRELGFQKRLKHYYSFNFNFNCPTSNIYHFLDENSTSILPLSIKYCQMPQNHSIISVGDESGCISIFSINQEIKLKDKWQAHSNSIFDHLWIGYDEMIVTASGDCTIKVFDIETKIPILNSENYNSETHSASIKSISSDPSNPHILVSAGRDGKIIVWDLRIPLSLHPSMIIPQTHELYRSRSHFFRQNWHAVTSVVHIDEHLIASSGASDGLIKIWDSRFTPSPKKNKKICPIVTFSRNNLSEERPHGISHLSISHHRDKLIAGSTDNKIYLYNLFSTSTIPISSYCGHIHQGFYIKCSFSPDDNYIISGSSDSHIYIWLISHPNQYIRLSGHNKETTSVEWNPSDISCITSVGDDYSLRLWNLTSLATTSNQGIIPSQNNQHNQHLFTFPLNQKNISGTFFYR